MHWEKSVLARSSHWFWGTVCRKSSWLPGLQAYSNKKRAPLLIDSTLCLTRSFCAAGTSCNTAQMCPAASLPSVRLGLLKHVTQGKISCSFLIPSSSFSSGNLVASSAKCQPLCQSVEKCCCKYVDVLTGGEP